jgi:hypothetical protein
MATLEALKPQCVLLVRGEGIILMLLKNLSSTLAFETFEIPVEWRFPQELLPALPRAKLTSDTFN